MTPACALVATLLPHLRRWALRLSRDLPRSIEAGDLVQLGALAVLRAHDGYDPARSSDVVAHCRVRAWNAMRDARRSLRREGEIATAAEGVDVVDLSGRDDEGARAALSVRPWLALRVAELPHRLRDVVTLRYAEDLDVREIGVRLGLSSARVSQLHGEALALLRGGGE